MEQSKRIGPYRLVSILGEGGMGTVYRAEQDHPMRRTVALKLIKLGMDTKAVVARFEAERQALALMDHPNIARVHDAGATDAGRPYFVMEYVDGTPITSYCDANRLGIRARLRLFASVCYAVHHAHQKGVVHRDVKPSNVLVAVHDGRAVPKVIDFGIAKAIEQRLTEHSVYTAVGQIIGTPEYMSPEQADFGGHDIDATTDVYSLGVLAYELVVGTLPLGRARLRGSSLTELLRLIRDEEPPSPATRIRGLGATAPETAARRGTSIHKLRREVRRDLDWVIMRALEKDRTRRYPSAWNLARDIERYLDDEPVEAGPPGAAYRLSKLMRRNKGAVVSVASVAVLLLLGTITSTTLSLRAERARARAETEAHRASAVTTFLSDMLGSAAPRNKGRDVTVREILDEAAATLGDRFTGEPLVRAQVSTTLGSTYHALGMWSDAERHFRATAEAMRTSPGQRDTLYAAALDDWARAAAALGRHARAESLSTIAFQVRRQVLGPWHEDVARTLADMGTYTRMQGNAPLAARRLEEALALLPESEASSLDTRCSVLESLGLLYADGLDRRRATACLQEAVRLYGQRGDTTDAAYTNL